MQVGDWTLFLLLANVICGSLYLAMLPPCATRVERNPCRPQSGCVHKRPSDLIVFFLIWLRPRTPGCSSRGFLGGRAGYFCPSCHTFLPRLRNGNIAIDGDTSYLDQTSRRISKALGGHSAWLWLGGHDP